MTKQEAVIEIEEMVKVYKETWPNASGFLVGSSLVGNHQGDSARYWELKEFIDK